MLISINVKHIYSSKQLVITSLVSKNAQGRWSKLVETGVSVISQNPTDVFSKYPFVSAKNISFNNFFTWLMGFLSLYF